MRVAEAVRGHTHTDTHPSVLCAPQPSRSRSSNKVLTVKVLVQHQNAMAHQCGMSMRAPGARCGCEAQLRRGRRAPRLACRALVYVALCIE